MTSIMHIFFAMSFARSSSSSIRVCFLPSLVRLELRLCAFLHASSFAMTAPAAKAIGGFGLFKPAGSIVAAPASGVRALTRGSGEMGSGGAPARKAANKAEKDDAMEE